MPYEVRNLPVLTPTSSGSTTTIGVGSLDDAEALTIFFVSTANALTTAWAVEVSQFDPAIAAPNAVTQSTNWHQLTSAPLVDSSGKALRISPVSFRGIRLSGATSSPLSNTVAYLSKLIVVS